jgi:hypothetical protein
LAAAPTLSRLPLRYFSQEQLFSVAARQDWITPDLQQLQWC